MGQLLRTKRHTATGKQSQVLVAAVNRHMPATAASGYRLRIKDAYFAHVVDLGNIIDFGGLLNAAVGRRRLCNSSTQSSRVLGRAGKLTHQYGYLVRSLDPRLALPQAGVASMWRFTAAAST